jgi:hypothetical protein
MHEDAILTEPPRVAGPDHRCRHVPAGRQQGELYDWAFPQRRWRGSGLGRISAEPEAKSDYN